MASKCGMVVLCFLFAILTAPSTTSPQNDQLTGWTSPQTGESRSTAEVQVQPQQQQQEQQVQQPLQTQQPQQQTQQTQSLLQPQQQSQQSQSQPQQQSQVSQSQPQQQSQLSQSQPLQQSQVSQSQPLQQSQVSQSQPLQQSQLPQSQPQQQLQLPQTQPQQQSQVSQTQPQQQQSQQLQQQPQQQQTQQANIIQSPLASFFGWLTSGANGQQRLGETATVKAPVVETTTVQPQLSSSAPVLPSTIVNISSSNLPHPTVNLTGGSQTAQQPISNAKFPQLNSTTSSTLATYLGEEISSFITTSVVFLGAALGREGCDLKAACLAGAMAPLVQGRDIAMVAAEPLIPETWKSIYQAARLSMIQGQNCTRFNCF